VRAKRACARGQFDRRLRYGPRGLRAREVGRANPNHGLGAVLGRRGCLRPRNLPRAGSVAPVHHPRRERSSRSHPSDARVPIGEDDLSGWSASTRNVASKRGAPLTSPAAGRRPTRAPKYLQACRLTRTRLATRARGARVPPVNLTESSTYVIRRVRGATAPRQRESAVIRSVARWSDWPSAYSDYRAAKQLSNHATRAAL